MLRAALAASLLLSACGGVAPLFCDEDTPCEDPARPFCDLNGEHPASEGIGRTCIPNPFDAGVDPDAGNATCNPRIAFSQDNGSGQLDIFIINRDGTGLENFSNDGANASSPHWAPDGSAIAYEAERSNGIRNIAVRQIATRERVFATNELERAASPRWSPNSDRLAYLWSEGIQTGLAFVDPDGGNRVEVPKGNETITGPRWAPDGSKILFRASGFVELIDADGLNRVALGIGGAGNWSASGTSIVFNRAVAPQDNDIFTMNADGSGATNITSNPAQDVGGQFDRDSRLLFVSDRPGLQELHVMNSDGSGLIQATIGTFDVVIAEWSPDGEDIAFVRSDELWIVNIETRTETLLRSGIGSPFFAWEPCP